MRINKKLQMIYYNIPKTGTQTLDVVIPRISNPIWIRPSFDWNPKPPSEGAKSHYRVTPNYAKTYKKIISVRNPYSRMLSMYNFELGRNSENAVGKTFKQYCEWALELTVDADINTTDDKIYRYFPCWKYAQTNGWDYVIRTEHMISDLKNIPSFADYPGSLPQINASKGPNWQQAHTPEIIKIINRWAGKEFDIFGYEKL